MCEMCMCLDWGGMGGEGDILSYHYLFASRLETIIMRYWSKIIHLLLLLFECPF